MKKRLWEFWQAGPVAVRKPFIAILGGTLLLAGLAMMALPGPGLATIFLALLVLQTEFAWAKRLRHRLNERFHSTIEAIKSKKDKS